MNSKPNEKEIERRQLLAFQLFYLQVREAIRELEGKLEALKGDQKPDA